MIRIQKMLEVALLLPDSEYDSDSWETCVVGRCCKEPWFKDRGLSLAYSPGSLFERPYCEGKWGFDAVAEFLDIDRDLAQAIFGSGRELSEVRGLLKQLLEG